MPVLSGTPMRSSFQPVLVAYSVSRSAQRHAQTAMRSEETDSGQTETPCSSARRSCTNQSVVR